MQLIEKFDKRGSYESIFEKEQILVMPPKTMYINLSVKNFYDAQKSVDIITTQKRSMQSHSIYSEAEKKAIERGVRIRIIKEKISHTQEFQSDFNYSNIEQRFCKSPLRIVGGIFDKKLITLILHPNSNYKESPCLFTNNVPLVLLFSTYFDTMWNSLENIDSMEKNQIIE